ncbi:MAG: GNAT family N-acetyltransferase [Leptolyngbyaceae cyanobacterium RU_5_1]|nr:GNAT family N-acetyltransferase [Leptolyngbyaceae cyanobacterium RU_5_1]
MTKELNFQLESSRLLLKPISLDFRDEIFREFTSEVTTYMHPKPAESPEETEHFIRKAIQLRQDGTDLILVILRKNNLEFVGVCGIHHLNTHTPELGIWTKKSSQGNGYGREAIHRLKQWADESLSYTYLSYPVDKRNIPSRKIPESLGGRVAREFQQTNLSGNVLDEVEYRIYREVSGKRTNYRDFVIRDWQPSDRHTAAEIIRSVLSEYGLSWEPAGADRDVLEVEACYLKTGGEFWVIEQQDKLVGTGAYYPIQRGQNAAEIRKMYLLPEVRGQGLGRLLLVQLETAIAARGFEQIWIETASVLKEAVKLYESSDYQPAIGVETARCDRVYVKPIGERRKEDEGIKGKGMKPLHPFTQPSSTNTTGSLLSTPPRHRRYLRYVHPVCD